MRRFLVSDARQQRLIRVPPASRALRFAYFVFVSVNLLSKYSVQVQYVPTMQHVIETAGDVGKVSTTQQADTRAN